MKILAVDDDPIFLEILGAALRDTGNTELTLVLSASEALYELQTQPASFDCILLDIQMPGMNGIELCAQIRKMTQYRRTPILMVTSMSARCFIDDAFAAGATDYMTKPLDLIEFRARMGMMERLVYEQLRSSLLEHQVGVASGMVELQYELQTPVMIPGFERGTEYLALQNYLLTLGLRDSYFVSAFAINISNAGVIYQKATSLSFMNMLADVAAIIDDALRSTRALISYAGNGTFVVALNGLGEMALDVIEAEINQGIRDFDSIYIADRLPLPQLRVGRSVRSTFFSRDRATRMLERAIASAQEKPAPSRAEMAA